MLGSGDETFGSAAYDTDLRPRRLWSVRTGAIQFQDDWPGLFVRGDDAIVPLSAIEQLAERLAGNEDLVVASALLRLKGIADIIDRDVIIRRSDV